MYVQRKICVHATTTSGPNNLALHSPQTASKPLTTSPHTLPASLSASRRSHSPFSIQRVLSSRPSSSRRISATSSRTDLRRRDAVFVSWRDSWSVSLRARRAWLRSEVCVRRPWREWRGFGKDGSDCCWEAEEGVVVVLGVSFWRAGKGMLGRMSSMRGIRSSMSSGESVGNGAKRRGCVRVWRVRIWCVMWEVSEEWAVISLDVERSASKEDIANIYLKCMHTWWFRSRFRPARLGPGGVV